MKPLEHSKIIIQRKNIIGKHSFKRFIYYMYDLEVFNVRLKYFVEKKLRKSPKNACRTCKLKSPSMVKSEMRCTL